MSSHLAKNCTSYPYLLSSTRRYSSNGFWTKPLNFIAGERVRPTNDNRSQDFSVVEPATGKILCESPSSGKADVDRAVKAAQEAFQIWSQVPAIERARIMQKTARKLAGSTFPALVVPCIHPSVKPWGMRGIGAWNYPIQMAGWKAAPALGLVFGNTMVFKPLPVHTTTALLLADSLYWWFAQGAFNVCRVRKQSFLTSHPGVKKVSFTGVWATDCGLPKGAFNVVQGQGETGHLLTSHPGVKKVSFTGIVATGKLIMKSCADDIKSLTLELGGKSPLLIFSDADLDNAAKGAVMANFLTQGEVCSNATRILGERSIKDEFVKRFIERTKKMKIKGGRNAFPDSALTGLSLLQHHARRALVRPPPGRQRCTICVGIGAWNYPIQMAGWKSAPALACGNTMVFKPSQFTPATALLLAEVYADCGLPKGAFNVVQGEGETGHFLTSHPGVKKVSFTGSVATGKLIMKSCADDIKSLTLELGGKSPLLIFSDADLDNAAKGAVMANFLTQGEVCSNATRIFVERSIKDEFVKRFIERTKKMKIGDPHLEDTTFGALISKAHQDKVMGYIEGAKKEGATILYGGERVTPDDPALADGFYILPTIMDNVTDDMVISREEVFGPVATIMTFDTEEEAVTRANNTQLGLACGLFTKDVQRAHRVAAQLEAGNCWINNYNNLPPGVPFGGYKQSGLGRENGTATIDHYTQLKTVYVEAGDVDCPV
eukprot:XP_011676578.1 PREDICTED: aldehyde dehydrogenase family 9 member A1-A [Strongylocentrotus purpuratus]